MGDQELQKVRMAEVSTLARAARVEIPAMATLGEVEEFSYWLRGLTTSATPRQKLFIKEITSQCVDLPGYPSEIDEISMTCASDHIQRWMPYLAPKPLLLKPTQRYENAIEAKAPQYFGRATALACERFNETVETTLREHAINTFDKKSILHALKNVNFQDKLQSRLTALNEAQGEHEQSFLRETERLNTDAPTPFHWVSIQQLDQERELAPGYTPLYSKVGLSRTEACQHIQKWKVQ